MNSNFVFKMQSRLLTNCTLTEHKSRWKNQLHSLEKKHAIIIVKEKKCEHGFSVQRKKKRKKWKRKKLENYSKTQEKKPFNTAEGKERSDKQIANFRVA